MNTLDADQRARFSRVFALADRQVIATLAERVVDAAERIEVLQEPATSLVMLETLDSVSGGSFYAGEVLVTSCQVLVDGRLGCAVVIGDDADRVQAAALLDAALQSSVVDDQLIATLSDEEQQIDHRHRAAAALAARTRVQFETMEDRDTGNDLRPRI